jgi:cytochrome c-type biogenesis protein CcmE
MTTGWKLAIAGAVVTGVTAYMAYLGAEASWQYYVTVDECLANASDLQGNRIRVSGKIAGGTLRIAPDRTEVAFSLESANGKLDVICLCPPPDNLTDGKDVVVEGHLEEGELLRGEKVLTRCASKYQAQKPDAASRAPAPCRLEQTP